MHNLQNGVHDVFLYVVGFLEERFLRTRVVVVGSTWRGGLVRIYLGAGRDGGW